jgi:hypothetical protein
MNVVQQYRQMAKEAFESASSARTKRARERFLDVARNWEEMAIAAEKNMKAAEDQAVA